MDFLDAIILFANGILAEIRNLDSDRKSLVYDNYSKLLAATSTIRRMRTNMDPLAPTTHTLSPAISHIAETAASLSSSIHSLPSRPQGLGIEVRIGSEEQEAETTEQKKKEKETVQWVLDTPRRLRALVGAEKEEEAEREWHDVSRILDKWSTVPGVDELRSACEEIMEGESEDASE